jgi:hypothetical protein
MPNPHPPLTNLKPQTPKWQHLPTKALRVPEVFLEEIADFAKKLDHGELSAPSLQHPAKITLTRSPLEALQIELLRERSYGRIDRKLLKRGEERW